MSIANINNSQASTMIEAKLPTQKMARLARELREGKIVGKNKLPYAQKARMAKAARGMESLFLNNLIKTMKQSMLEEPDSEFTFGADMLGSFGDMKLSEQLASKGPGIGIAKMVYKQLTGGEELIDFPHTPPPPSSIQNNFELKLKDRISNYDEIIQVASETFDVDISLIKAVIGAESAGKTDAVSKAGAKGLMQLMDNTAKSVGVNNSFDPKENIIGGTNYLKQMMQLFGSKELGLAAYNAGPNAVMKYDGVPPYKETQSYIKRIQEYQKNV